MEMMTDESFYFIPMQSKRVCPCIIINTKCLFFDDVVCRSVPFQGSYGLDPEFFNSGYLQMEKTVGDH